MSRRAAARQSSHAGSLGVSSSTLELERPALPAATGGPEDGEDRRIAVVGTAGGVLAAKVIVGDVPRLSPLVQERPIAVFAVLQVKRDRRARPVTAVDVAAVDHAAMMKAHLPLSERDDALERLVLLADEPPLECLEILRIERPHGLRVGPSVAAVDIDDRPHLDWTIVQRDPCREHVLGRARYPVGTVGVPADDGPERAGRRRLRDELA